ncbi:LysR family transcriptional regulator [Amycolatopsis sp. H20-H5]|uniref:LysR family transcriptional regulator n=1 Tax=Amycolatopsis sp. H20-H5 TaxID=3046309 RepID=UPI002DB91650|nr:LysR family transcriptional regulator [Amycolatopsis sp. H20-H5]MEC3975152.1 LysR family transcriptional regulator [Amycolatopsis sp. H20-H5]
MELRLLRYFSTPTLSQQIKVLEREVGSPLLLRDSRGVRLTAAGEVLRGEAARTLRAAADALRGTRRARRPGVAARPAQRRAGVDPGTVLHVDGGHRLV